MDDNLFNILTRGVQEILDHHELSDKLCLFAYRLMQADGCMLSLYEEGTCSLKVASLKLPEQFHAVEKSYLDYRIGADEQDLNYTAFKTRQDQRIKDVNQMAPGSSTRSRFERWLMQDMLIIPIVSNGVALGSMMLFTTESSLDETQLERLKHAISQLFGPQINKAINFREMKHHNRYIQSFAEASTSFCEYLSCLNARQSLDDVNQKLSDYFLKLLDCDIASFGIVDDGLIRNLNCTTSERVSEETVRIWNAHYDNSPFRLEMTEGATAICYLQRLSLYFNDVRNIMHLPMADNDRTILSQITETKALALIPVFYGEEVVAVFGIWNLHQDHCFEEHQIKLIEALCGIAAPLLHELIKKKAQQANPFLHERRTFTETMRR